MKALKILYFVSGAAPTAEQYAEANALNGNICFRNALAISSEATLEECDGVAGDVPAVYSAKFPDAVAAIEGRAKTIEALSKKVGDEPAPKAPTAAAMTAPASEPAPAAPAAPAPDAPAPAAPAKAASDPAKAPGWKPNA